MAYTVEQIATALGAEAFGAVDMEIDGLAEPADATARDLALAMKPEYADSLPSGAAKAAMVWDGADWQSLGLEAAIISPRPRYTMSGLTTMMDPGQGWADGIHPTASVDDRAELGAGVSVGPMAVVCAGARIGAGTVIGPQAFVGTDAQIGTMGFLREGVRIGARVKIGERFIAQPGAVVGGDGFSYVTPEKSSVEQARQTLGDQGDTRSQAWTRIHSLGAVSIGDDVELGSNCTIDRGTIRDTRIGNGTKIDNLVMVGHNVEIGNDSLLCGCVGIAGSTRIGNNVVLGGQTGVSDNIFIGDNVITGGGTIVLSNIPAGRVMLGYPAMKMETTMEIFKGLRRLKRLFNDVADLKKAVSKPDASD
ncbi:MULTISPECIES: UDP-3-O-(3-hydroxymyristoyl)glucosamine N-acyltransferase [unclassified Roseovarius]|uniref:UDP-3-O-(3-hydroxymyristoyl)glucosamine N-acyltransferase n=1 Tax=unclassified Roseovarius TaxID=2614913 RepID=UPI00273FC045|nr:MULTISPECIES: UDP-3-O-(3-hydroxymyristoyl)glucosamine N-acyltransferase [unclassified Roseovarius]